MFYCEWCEKQIKESEIEYRLEDDSFSAPYGDIFVPGGSIYRVEICPDCKEDLEEVEE